MVAFETRFGLLDSQIRNLVSGFSAARTRHKKEKPRTKQGLGVGVGPRRRRNRRSGRNASCFHERGRLPVMFDEAHLRRLGALALG